MADPIRILVVDDNADARAFLHRLLTYEPGMDIAGEAANGLEAIDSVRELAPHVVLMDINMPVMDGITACGHIKREFPAVQVIIISVQDDIASRHDAVAQGADAFVVKPTPPEDLIDLIVRAYAAYQRIAAG